MRILVTGGAGYLGSILVPYLLSQGHAVTVLDNLLYGQTTLMECCSNPAFEFVSGDVREESAIRGLIAKADCIIPLAAIVGAPACGSDRLAATSTNLDAITLISKLRSKQQYILFPTTNSGYGIGAPGIPCTEESPLRPVSHYGFTKVAAEKILLDSGEAITFRLATVFGASPRMRIDLLVNDFVRRALVDRVVVLFEAHFKRNYLHIRDVARAFVHGLTNYESMKGNPYNVGLSDANLSKLELCRKIREHLPQFVFFESNTGEDPDKRDYIVSNKRIEDTGWKPAYSLDNGIKELIKAYQIAKIRSYANI